MTSPALRRFVGRTHPSVSGALTAEPVDVRAGLDGTVEITLPRVEDLQQSITVTAPAFQAPVTNRCNFASYSWNRRTNAQQFGEQQGIFPILGLDWRF